MNVLLIGSGGREHALAWRLAQSPGLQTMWAIPGNPGIAEVLRTLPGATDPNDIGQHGICFRADVGDHETVIDFCRTYDIGLVVIGPEAPLVDGLGDSLRAAGIAVFGPDKAAAQLEGSKGFTKDLCTRADIPTAGYVRVTDLNDALLRLNAFPLPVVIKADGLAAGKGVTVAMSRAEAEDALTAILSEDGGEAVIEEFLDGEEVSLFVLTDGVALMPFGTAQDHKRVGEGDTGPNTGGMGAYSPAPVLTPELERRALDEIVAPTVAAMAAAGTPFSGVLYAGLMLTREGPKLIEYNARFGDPECQVLMMRYQGDLLALLLAVAEGRLAEQPTPEFSEDTALTVVMAANGYPGTPDKGGTIGGIADVTADARVFQAGTALDGDRLVANGGRVLAVTALAPTIAAARDAAYAAVAKIDFPSGFNRSDIGWREIARGPEDAAR